MKISKNAKQLAKDLGLNDAEAVVMEIKSKLYESAQDAILSSKLTHESIAEKIGTSRARISRISKMGENSISIELLVKIIVTLDEKVPFKFTTAS